MSRLKTLPPRVPTLVVSRTKVIDASSWRAGKTSTGRGYGYKWQQARAGYLVSHPLCVMCSAEGKVTAATVVDHIVPHQGDQARFWDRSNWQSLCADHHDRDKAQAERAQGLR